MSTTANASKRQRASTALRAVKVLTFREETHYESRAGGYQDPPKKPLLKGRPMPPKPSPQGIPIPTRPQLQLAGSMLGVQEHTSSQPQHPGTHPDPHSDQYGAAGQSDQAQADCHSTHPAQSQPSKCPQSENSLFPRQPFMQEHHPSPEIYHMPVSGRQSGPQPQPPYRQPQDTSQSKAIQRASSWS